MAYAEVADVEARWHSLSGEERQRASVLIEDASAMLDGLVKVDEDDEAQACQLKTVCCNMVIRSMVASMSDMYGVSQQSVTAGPYSQSLSYSNPSGDMYLTKMERRLLGISGSGQYRSIDARTWADGPHD